MLNKQKQEFTNEVWNQLETKQYKRKKIKISREIINL